SVMGSATCAYSAYVYTDGSHNGSVTIPNTLAAGTYVARAFSKGSCSLVKQSDPFTVVQRVATNATNYPVAPASVTVNWQNLPAGMNTLGLVLHAQPVGTFVHPTTTALPTAPVT